MSEEKIEQQVTLSGNARVEGDINLIGKIYNVVKHPAEWQDKAFDFLLAHRYFVLVAAVLQIGLLTLYWVFRNLYLIPWWLWAVAAVLLLAAAWTWYTYNRSSRTRIRLAMAVASSLSFAALIGLQARQIIFPERFDTQVFGIALAELGAGPNFQRTALTGEITVQVYELLCAATREAFATAGTPAPCDKFDTSPDPRQVALRRIGVIPDSQTAQRYGRQIEADIVIWGHVLTSAQGNVTIRFQVLETLDSTVNPDFPVVLPVTLTHTDIYASGRELNLSSDPLELKEIVAQQSTAISSFILGVIAYLNQDFVMAISHLEAFVQVIEEQVSIPPTIGRGLSIPYYYLGIANHFLGRVELAQMWLSKAKTVNPDEPAIALSLAYGHRSLGESEKFQAELERALDLLNARLNTHPNDLAALYDRGIIYELRGEPEFALFDYEDIIKQDPTFYLAYAGMGNAAFKVGDLTRAESALQQALALAQETGANTAVVYVHLARIWQQRGELDRADSAYQEAIAAAPQRDYLYREYVQFLAEHQDDERALQVYQDMIAISPQKSGAYRETAGFLRSRGRLEEALTYYRRAVHSDPEEVLARTYMAETLYELGQVVLALEEYETAVAKNDTDYYVYSSYAATLQREGHYERAVEMYEKSLAIRPVAPAELESLATLHLFLQRCDDAETVFRRILSQREQLPEELVRYAEDGLRNLSACPGYSS